MTPKLIFDCDGVLDPKDEDVSSDEDDVVVEDDHRLDRSFEDELKVTELSAERSCQVAEDVEARHDQTFDF